MAMAKTDLLLRSPLEPPAETPEVFWSSSDDRRRRASTSTEPARSRVSREAHRRGAVPGLRQHAQPGLQGAAAAAVEEGSDRPDDGAAEPDQAADPVRGLEGHLRVRQGRPTGTADGRGPRSARRAGAIRAGDGHLERHLLSRRDRQAAAARSSTSWRSTPSTSTRSRSTRRFYRVPAADDGARAGPSARRGLRVLAEAVPEVHAPGDVPEGDRQRSRATSARRTSTSSAPRIDPLASAGQARRAARAVPAELQERAATRAATSSGCCTRSGTTRSRWSCGTGAGATIRAETLRLLAEYGAALGADRRAEVQDLDPAEPAAERQDVLLPAAARPERRAVVDAREVRGPLQLPVFGRRSWSRSPRRRKRRRAR